jgi:hypothetical protein
VSVFRLGCFAVVEGAARRGRAGVAPLAALARERPARSRITRPRCSAARVLRETTSSTASQTSSPCASTSSLIFNSMELFRYREVATELIVVLVFVLAVERVSSLLRSRIV